MTRLGDTIRTVGLRTRMTGYSAVNETLFNAVVRLFDRAPGFDADNT